MVLFEGLVRHPILIIHWILSIYDTWRLDQTLRNLLRSWKSWSSHLQVLGWSLERLDWFCLWNLGILVHRKSWVVARKRTHFCLYVRKLAIIANLVLCGGQTGHSTISWHGIGAIARFNHRWPLPNAIHGHQLHGQLSFNDILDCLMGHRLCDGRLGGHQKFHVGVHSHHICAQRIDFVRFFKCLFRITVICILFQLRHNAFGVLLKRLELNLIWFSGGSLGKARRNSILSLQMLFQIFIGVLQNGHIFAFRLLGNGRYLTYLQTHHLALLGCF